METNGSHLPSGPLAEWELSPQVKPQRRAFGGVTTHATIAELKVAVSRPRTVLECQVSKMIDSDTRPHPTTGGGGAGGRDGAAAVHRLPALGGAAQQPGARARAGQQPQQPSGRPRARSHCRFAPPLIHFITDLLTYSVPLFLKRQCDRTLRSALTSATDALSCGTG